MKTVESSRRTLLIALAALASPLSGCATASASRAQARVDVPAAWAEVPTGAGAPAAAEWWRDFGSTELDALVAAALQANPDLRSAAARVAQARAFVDGTDAERRPQLGALAGARRGRDSSADPKVDATAFGLRASWEADVFGRSALAGSAARADALGADEALAAARTMLAADVAEAWFVLRTLARRIELGQQADAIAMRQIEVAKRKLDAGQASALDVDRWQAEQAQEQAALAQLRGEQRVRLRQLALVLGASRAPEPVPAAISGAAPQAPAALLPGELLERRPDVRGRAHALDAALARLGVARREVYPRLEIDWAARKERLAVAGSAASPQLALGYGVTLSLPLLDGGRIAANVAIHEAKAQEAMAEYEKAMLAALADAETALARWTAADDAVRQWQQAEASADTAARRSQRLYDAGLADAGAVLDARRGALRSRDVLCQAEGARWTAAVALRRAFSGKV